jgi:hypothetical protein
VEPIEIDTEVRSTTTIEDILVVEATLTNEFKQHEVYLKKGSSFTADSMAVVQNAQVNILDDEGNTFIFFESDPGTYRSEISFQALAENEYRLQIETEGKAYTSEWVTLPSPSAITNVFAERITNDLGVEGIGIFVDANVAEEEPPLLRFSYEETYKIIAPLWSPFDMVVLDPNPPFAFGLEPREQEERVCYATQLSNEIIQTEGFDVTGTSIENILVRFISRDDFIISHRYSILVKQLVQSPDAFAFYQTLNELSSNNSVFTDVQPGFIEGNMSNSENPDEKVLGYFEVANQTEKRLFFNYEDFFAGEDLPPYAISCSFLSAPATITPGGNSPLKDIIEGGDFIYVRDTNGSVFMGGPYFVARRACGDCTVLGSNIVPEFWIEE